MKVPEKSRKTEHLIKKFVNTRRVDRGLDRLDSDRALDASAHEHARDMARRGYYDHETPEGLEPSDRSKQYKYVAECIAMSRRGHRSPGTIAGDLVGDWMKSTGHRRYLLAGEYTLVGAGAWLDGRDVYGVLHISKNELRRGSNSGLVSRLIPF